MELPSNYLEEMKELLGDQYEAYLASFEQKTRQGLRVNTAKIAPETFRQKADISLECVPWCENGFAFDEKQTVTKHPYYYAGLYYVQEPSAMIPASHLPVEPGDFVLDLCAAPGGKATELGAKLKGKGMLLANDISNSRAKGLLKNLELFGISNLFVSSEESDKLKKAYPAYFDKILIDAPCSGEGMFRRDKAMVKDWLQKGPDYYVPIQRKLLLDAADMLKKGVIVRHLVLPYHYRDSVEVIKRVGERFGKHVLFSLMSQYTPFWKAKDIPQLNRRITTFEYRKALDAVYEAGLEGFMQERSSAREEYTPDFDLSGI